MKMLEGIYTDQQELNEQKYLAKEIAIENARKEEEAAFNKKYETKLAELEKQAQTKKELDEKIIKKN